MIRPFGFAARAVLAIFPSYRSFENCRERCCLNASKGMA